MMNGFEIENGILKKYHGRDAGVVIPDGVTQIGSWAFSKCKGLSSVTIPAGVTVIGAMAFDSPTA